MLYLTKYVSIANPITRPRLQSSLGDKYLWQEKPVAHREIKLK